MFLSLSLSFNKFSQTITALDVFTTPRRGRGRRRGNDRRVDHDWRDVNETDDSGMTPLTYARQGNANAMAILLETEQT